MVVEAPVNKEQDFTYFDNAQALLHHEEVRPIFSVPQ
jgi:hypothetical protein